MKGKVSPIFRAGTHVFMPLMAGMGHTHKHTLTGTTDDYSTSCVQMSCQKLGQETQPGGQFY